MIQTRDDALAFDAADALAPLREQFTLPEGLIYLDGNSLGVLPRAAPARVAQVVQQEWGEGLIRSWNRAGWIELPQRVGDRIARLVGAGPGELVVCDSTSVNLFKVLSAALRIAREDDPARSVIVSETRNFPTDLYIGDAVAELAGATLRLVDDPRDLPRALGADTALLMLTHVNFHSGRMHDLAGLTAIAHAAGALTVWDLAHSAGAVPVDLKGSEADFAVGCGYKYLNGGPGAPAFVWVHPRHVDRFRQPLSGWLGHAAPFEFSPRYRPAPGIGRYLCGTPPVVSLATLECGVDTVLAAEPLGGMAALRAKSLALTHAFAARVNTRCEAHGLRVVSPLDDHLRGSQVCLAFDDTDGQAGARGWAVMQALIDKGVVGDFRAPDILRFGFAPLYTRFADVWDAVETLAEVLDRGLWREPRFQQHATVT